MVSPSPDRGRAAFLEAFPVPRETLARLDAHVALLDTWQPKINLVGPSTLQEVWTRHVLDSAQLLGSFEARPAGGPPPVWLDLGSGAGFPGLVLDHLGAGHVHLVESDGRKCAFLRQVTIATGSQARIHTCRIERMEPFAVDIVTARALAPLADLLAYAEPFVSQDSEFRLLKGEQAEKELTRARQSWTFDVESLPSRSDPRGVLLRLTGVRRRQQG